MRRTKVIIPGLLPYYNILEPSASLNFVYVQLSNYSSASKRH